MLVITTLVTLVGPVHSFVYLAIVIPWTEIILCNSIIPVRIFAPNIFSVKNIFYLTVANIICAKIVNENNCLKNKTTLHRFAWKTTFTARKRTLKLTHPPLSCLPKQCVNIADPKQVVLNIMMKMLRLPFCYLINKSPMCVSTPGKALIDTDFIRTDFPLNVM
jgi:hypothetical protein